MPTLRELRRATSDKVAPCSIFTTGVLGSNGAYQGTALGGRRQLATSDLASVDAEGYLPEAPPDAHTNDWLYVLTTVPQQRRVPERGFNGYARADAALTGYNPAQVAADEPVAILTLERPLLSTAPAGTTVEIHAVPQERAGRSAGLISHIQHATRVILREDTVNVAAQAGSYRYDVTAQFPWLVSPWMFRDLRYPEGTVAYDTCAIPGATLRFDADKVLLSPNAGAPAGQTFPVRVLRPLSSWIKPAGGAWGESAVGLVADLDECLGVTDSIALVAAFHAADGEARASIVGSAEQRFWVALGSALAARAAPFMRDQRTRQQQAGPAPFPDLISPYGPLGGRFGPGFK
jgi:hypothetical protein